jgi:PEP-CTERM motif
LKLVNALVVAALVLFTAGVVHADDLGGDSRIVIVPGDPPPLPSCGSIQVAADSGGAISADCTVTGSAPATSITFAVPAADTLGGLSCDSVLSDDLNWAAATSTATIGGVAVDECTFTAPTKPTTLGGLLAYLATPGGSAAYLYAATNDPGAGGFSTFNPLGNDGDCDADDFMFGIPVGCDLGFNTPGVITNPTQLFVPDALADLSTTGTSGLVAFPEPGTLALMLLGLGSLVFMRRRAVQR